MRILASFTPDAAERALVDGMLDVTWLVDGADPADAEVMLSFWPRKELRGAGITWADLPRLRRLKLATAGVNHVGWSDLPETIRVHATPATTGPFIAEHVLGGVIAWARDFMRSTQAIRDGRFQVGQPVRAVSELRIGIIGHGGLGQAIAATLAAHGAAIRAVSRSGRRAPDSPVEAVDTMDGLPELAHWADVLVVAVPLQRSTQGIVDAMLLQRLGSGLLVNVARGPIVDEAALHAWLTGDGRRGAVLDVWWDYPKDGGHPFTQPLGQLQNVIFTPHNSPNVAGHRLTMLRRACQDILDAASGRSWAHEERRQDYDMPYDGDGR